LVYVSTPKYTGLTMDGEKLGLVAVLTRSYMNGWIPFQDKIEQITEIMFLAPKQ